MRLPDHLVVSTKGRRDRATDSIETVIKQITSDFHSGALTAKLKNDPTILTKIGICRLAGRGKKFLYGKGREATLERVDTFIVAMEKALVGSPDPLGSEPDKRMQARVALLAQGESLIDDLLRDATGRKLLEDRSRQFVRELAEALSQSSPRSLVGSEDDKVEISRLNALVARLWNDVHYCRQKIHELRDEKRDMMLDKGPKIVPLQQ